MLFDTITGLLLHPLVVHATEVIVPSAALVLAVTAVLASAGTIVQAVRVGHSGATATWSHVVGSATPARAGDFDHN